MPSALFAQATGVQEGTITFLFTEKEVSGTLSDFSSSSVIDWKDLENSALEGQVASKTIRTGNFIRDFTLKRSTYFDVDKYPYITFKSSKIRSKEKHISVHGTLTLKGVAKPLTIVFQKEGNTLTGTTTLYTTDFNITVLKKGREANKVQVFFTLKLN